MIIPSTTEALEDFEIAFSGGELWGRFRRGSGKIVSLSEADEAYKSTARAEARPAPPLAAEVEDNFPRQC
jgi:hypothetical protein